MGMLKHLQKTNRRIVPFETRFKIGPQNAPLNLGVLGEARPRLNAPAEDAENRARAGIVLTAALIEMAPKTESKQTL